MLTTLGNLLAEPPAEPPKRRKRKRGSAKPHNRGPGSRELEPGMYAMIHVALTTRFKHKYRYSSEISSRRRGAGTEAKLNLSEGLKNELKVVDGGILKDKRLKLSRT